MGYLCEVPHQETGKCPYVNFNARLQGLVEESPIVWLSEACCAVQGRDGAGSR